jgi:hypothetical protein
VTIDGQEDDMTVDFQVPRGLTPETVKQALIEAGYAAKIHEAAWVEETAGGYIEREGRFWRVSVTDLFEELILHRAKSVAQIGQVKSAAAKLRKLAGVVKMEAAQLGEPTPETATAVRDLMADWPA